MTYFPHDVLDMVEATPLEVSTTAPPRTEYAFRRSMGVIEVVLAAAATVGVVQLLADVGAPPDSDIPFGLHSWIWPAIWLLVMVLLPSAHAAFALLRRWGSGPALVLMASALLAVELLVQIPFVGPSWLQLGVGLLGASAATMAVRARASTRSRSQTSR